MDKVLNKYLMNPSQKLEESFSVWLKKNNAVVPENAEKLYVQNILNAYKEKTKSDTTIQDDLKEFLQNVLFLFKGDANYDRIKNINLNDPSEIRMAMPWVIQKIKEIVDFYKKERGTIKDSRTRFFLNGTKGAIEIELYNLLKEWTTKNPDSSLDLSNYDLTGLKMEYVPLYDLTDYYKEQSQFVPILTKNPIFFSLVNYLEEFGSDVVTDTCDSNSYEIEDTIDYSQKYTGILLKYLSGYEDVWDFFQYTNNLKTGENFFYWISGENLYEKSETEILKTSLSSINWSMATASHSIFESDIIFVEGPEGKKAAWLKRYDNVIVPEKMRAWMKNEKEFRFPFPFVGLSGENLEWAGAGLDEMVEENMDFFSTDTSYQNYISQLLTLYWGTTSLGITSSPDIYLNDTSLYDSGAYASDCYENADKITIRAKKDDGILDGIYNSDVKHCWLYDFRNTELPIAAGANNLYWPIQRYADVSELFWEYKTENDIPLSSLNTPKYFTGAVASQTIENSDKIYRMRTYCGPDTECAWLSGVPLSSLNPNDAIECDCDGNSRTVVTRRRWKNGTVQNYVYFKALPNVFTRFHIAGLGENKTVLLNDLEGFRGQNHDPSCNYPHLKLNDLSVISKFNKKDLEVNQWKQCGCKTIKWSPFGHRGTVFTDFNKYCDFIVKDTAYPKEFSFRTWRGTDGKDYLSSKDFAWFKLEDSPDQNIGWGRGTWVTGSGEPMVLDSNSMYLYFRTSIDRCEGYDAPYAVLRETFCDCSYIDENCEDKNCKSVWRKAIKNDLGEWEDGGIISDMILQSNSFYRYEHESEYEFSTERIAVSGNYISNADYYTITPDNSSVSIFDEWTETMQGMNFVLNIPLISSAPFWADVNINLENVTIQPL